MKGKRSRPVKDVQEAGNSEEDDMVVKPLEAFARGPGGSEGSEESGSESGGSKGEPQASPPSSDSDDQADSGSESTELAAPGSDSEEELDQGSDAAESDEGEEGAEEDEGDEDLGLQDDEFELGEGSGEGGSDAEGEEAAEGGGDAIEEEAGAASGGSSDEAGPGRSGKGKDGKSLASAFADILAHPGPVNKKDRAPILLGSKSVAKRRREEVETTAAQRAAKKLRQEMKQRGHIAVSKKGEDPASDSKEKLLSKIATRGVVQLFNAVSKAQRAQKDALAAGAKAKDAKINKNIFFQELRGKGASSTVPAGRKEGITVGPREDVGAKKGLPKQQGKGWDVLKDDFAGLQGSSSTKMKDWDKAADPEDLIDGAVSGSESEGLGDW